MGTFFMKRGVSMSDKDKIICFILLISIVDGIYEAVCVEHNNMITRFFIGIITVFVSLLKYSFALWLIDTTL